MTSAELIDRLRIEDPTGTTEVTVDNDAVFFVARYPGYYDGHYVRFDRDASKEPYYNIAGAKIVSRGEKLRIHTLSLEQAINDNPALPVDITEVIGWQRDHLENRIKEYRAEAL